MSVKWLNMNASVNSKQFFPYSVTRRLAAAAAQIWMADYQQSGRRNGTQLCHSAVVDRCTIVSVLSHAGV